MNIAELMQRDVITAGEDESVLEASEKMRCNGIKHLPVLNQGGKIVGIVTDRDIKEASASDATSLVAQELTYLLEKLELVEIMTRDPITGTTAMSVPDAARVMYEQRIGCLPITEGSNLVGIVTSTDMLKFVADS